MKAVTLHRPWPALIFGGAGKNVENRSWYTHYRGPLLIHAGKAWDSAAELVAVKAGYLPAVARMSWRPEDHPVGLVGEVLLTGVCRDGRYFPSGHVSGCQCGPWAFAGQLHWQLTGVRALPEVVACTGHQGLWTVGPDVAALVKTML